MAELIMYTPKVSIIFLLNKYSKNIEKSLNSLLSQSLNELEILCVSENQANLPLLELYAQEDSRIKIFDYSTKSHPFTPISKCTGSFVMFCNDSTIYLPEICEKLVSFIQNRNTDCAVCGIRQIDMNGNEKELSYDEKVLDTPFDSFDIIDNNLENKIFRKIKIQKYGIEFDNAFLPKYLSVSDSVFLSSENLLLKSMTIGTNLTNPTGIVFTDILGKVESISQLYAFFLKNELHRKYKYAFISYIFSLIHAIWISIPDIKVIEFFSSLREQLMKINFKEYYYDDLTSEQEQVILALLSSNFYVLKNYFDFVIKNRDRYIIQDWPTPAFKKNNIAICFGCDNNFIKYFSVSLISLLDHLNSNYNYDIWLLHEDASQENMEHLLYMIDGLKNVSLRFFNIKYICDKYDVSSWYTHDHVNRVTYYSLFMGEIFKHYKKMLYLDSDMIVNADIVNLFNIDISQYAVAAVSDDITHSKYLCDHGINEYLKYTLKMKDPSHYFNAGLLLFNLERLREKNYLDQFIKIAKINNRFFCDQNVSNTVLENDKLLINPAWNVLIKEEKMSETFDYFSMVERPYIYHFSSKIKPWNGSTNKSYIWWSYAQKSSFYHEILSVYQKNLSTSQQPLSHEITQPKNDTIVSKDISPFPLIRKPSLNKLFAKLNDDYVTVLLKAYIKKGINYMFSYGNRKKNIRKQMDLLEEQISKEVNRAT